MTWRRARDAALLVASEVGVFLVGGVFLLGLAVVAMTILAVGAVGFTLGVLRDECADLWERVKRGVE